jgi:hypothetical protein
MGCLAIPRTGNFPAVVYRYYGIIATGGCQSGGACLHAKKSVRIIQRISSENQTFSSMRMGVETPPSCE